MIEKNKLVTLLAAAVFGATTANADSLGELIFEDDFERSESQETEDEPGNGWGTNSKSRAKGNKQVDLRDGAMHIYIHEEADHAVSVTQPIAFEDGSVSLRFQLKNAKDNLGLNFADLKFKEVHAGHLFVARISPSKVDLTDLKTGNMDLATRTARVAGKLSEEQKKKLKKKTKTTKCKLELNKWYQLLMTIKGDALSLSIDGQEIASFESEGIAHPTKRMLRLSVPKEAAVDDVKIYRSK